MDKFLAGQIQLCVCSFSSGHHAGTARSQRVTNGLGILPSFNATCIFYKPRRSRFKRFSTFVLTNLDFSRFCPQRPQNVVVGTLNVLSLSLSRSEGKNSSLHFKKFESLRPRRKETLASFGISQRLQFTVRHSSFCTTIVLNISAVNIYRDSSAIVL